MRLPGLIAAAGAAILLAPAAVQAAAPAPCPGAAITPDAVYAGDFSASQEGAFVMLPFQVPASQTGVRVKYCHDQPEAPTSAQLRHTLDIGVYGPRAAGALWARQEFRGWSGSGTHDVTVAENGYSPSPDDHDVTRTDRAYLPGPIGEGEWAVELGLASIVGHEGGDADGKVNWRVEIDWTADPAFASEPYAPAPYDSTPASSSAGWYAGDFHVHGEHSRDASASMREVFDYAFAPVAAGGAGLDFVTLSDHNTTSAWGEIGRYQPDYPGKLIVRSGEVTTYRGHANNHAGATWVDYRTGPVYERRADGGLASLRGPQPASAFLGQIRSAGGFTQINHPTIFPSQVPGFQEACRGCSWDYRDAETDYSLVDAIEVQTGPAGLEQEPRPGPNPFTPLAIEFWEDKLDEGYKIAPVGGSDSHDAGRRDSVTESPIGEPTTVVFAEELSEAGIRQAIQSRHSYVKMFGSGSPDLRFEARAPRAKTPAIMGDVVRSKNASFLARVIGGAAAEGSYQLVVFKDREPIHAVPVTSGDFRFRFGSQGPGRYRIQVQRGSAVEALASPIWLEP
ncbi:MAG TPA: CehA/McbA family metallohydrolase [Thermoleophilaceae bacterium]|nr:CehA/McbA family metallohydrolase [Thermoleophilaceae bacterium]